MATPSTPGSQALENLKNRDVEEFKKPNSNEIRKKPKPKILTEEKYIEELSKIIQRDFFPDLEKLRAQNDYLDALERKDYAQMQAIRAKYSGRQPTTSQGAMTPATFETPESAVESTPRKGTFDGFDTPKSTTSTSSIASKSDGSRGSLAEKHSLDSFLNAYTSEDNFSFQEIVDAADEKLRQKFAVLYNEERLSKEQLARALTIPSIENQFVSDPMRKIETWTYKNKNSIMFIPDGVDLTLKERIEKADCKQKIQHSATRLHSNPFDTESSQQAVSESAKATKNQIVPERIGVDGKIIIPNKGATPQIRGFGLVKTPSPRPGEAFSPLMTWGEIEGTPFRLDGSDTPVRPNTGPSFHINANSRRENIGLALAEKVGEKMRAQKQHAKDMARRNIGSPFIRSNLERLASISPAARRLATTKLGLRSPSLTPTYTPLIAKRKSTAGIQKRTPAVGKTNVFDDPKRKLPTPSSEAGSSKSTLTDDLLNIPTKPKRPSAADFF